MCNKTYTIGYMMWKDDVPFIRLSGNWLKEQGFNVGDKLKYQTLKHQILRKKQEIKRLEKQLKELKSN